MWAQMARVVGEVRPRFVFVENSPALITRGLGRVLSDLAALGYDCRWTVLGAADVGAPHRRDRFWLVAHADFDRMESGMWQVGESVNGEGGKGGMEAYRGCSDVADAGCKRYELADEAIRAGRHASEPCCEVSNAKHQRDGWQKQLEKSNDQAWATGSEWWATEPAVGRVADGMADRVDRLKAIGNGQVPQCAAQAWRILMGEV